MSEAPRYALEVERTFDAPRARVFTAWTTAEHLARWMHPAEGGWSTPVAEVDLRPGGAYRVGIRSPELGTFYEVGVYVEISPPERLVYTCRYECDGFEHPMPREEMLVTVEFHDLGAKTRVVVRQDGYVRREDRDEQQQGWPAFLARLAEHLAETSAPAAARPPRDSLAEMLQVEALGDGRFRARLESFWGGASTGDLLARAMLAATAPGGALPVALHASFFAPAPADAALLLACSERSPGRRSVEVGLGGERIAEVRLRFGPTHDGPSYQGVRPERGLPAPEELPSEVELGRQEGWEKYAVGPIETRRIGPREIVKDDEPSLWQGWLRPRVALPDDARLHAAALAFAAAYRSHWAVEKRLGADFPRAEIHVLDHVLFVHRAERFDDWWLVRTSNDVGAAGRCVSHREIYTRGGALVASAAWEASLQLAR